MSSGQVFNYLGSIVLVWVAFSMLPQSERPVALNRPGNTVPPPMETWEKLRWLLYYDMGCFALSLLILCLLAAMTCVEYYWRNDTLQGLTNEQQFHANLFWCNVFYSILSLPFCLVK